jgi:hypothetical protein
LTELKESETNEIILNYGESSIIKAMMNFFYLFDYNDQLAMDDSTICPMVFNAKMYSAADFYDIRHLKTLATQKFKIATENNWNNTPSLFAKAIAIVYDTTPESERALRDIVFEVTRKNLGELLDCSEFRDMLTDHGQFGLEIIQVSPLQCNGYECNHCQFKFIGDAVTMNLQNIHCPKCGRPKRNSPSSDTSFGSFFDLRSIPFDPDAFFSPHQADFVNNTSWTSSHDYMYGLDYQSKFWKLTFLSSSPFSPSSWSTEGNAPDSIAVDQPSQGTGTLLGHGAGDSASYSASSGNDDRNYPSVNSSMARHLRHEREMHTCKVHKTGEILCGYSGKCRRKKPGHGFTQDFFRMNHERQMHGMKDLSRGSKW